MWASESVGDPSTDQRIFVVSRSKSDPFPHPEDLSRSARVLVSPLPTERTLAGRKEDGDEHFPDLRDISRLMKNPLFHIEDPGKPARVAVMLPLTQRNPTEIVTLPASKEG